MMLSALIKPVIIATILSYGSISSALAQNPLNTTLCSGGSAGAVTCESNQEGFCDVENGKVFSRCKSIPSGLKGRDLELYILSEALRRNVSSAELEQKDGELKTALRTGRIQINKTKVIKSVITNLTLAS